MASHANVMISGDQCCRCGKELAGDSGVAMAFFGECASWTEETFDELGFSTHTTDVVAWCKGCYEKVFKGPLWIEIKKGRMSNG